MMEDKQLPSSWWTLDKDDAAKSMHCTVESINNDSMGIHTQNVQNLRLYTTQNATDMTISNYLVNAYQASSSFLRRGARMNWNVCKAAVDSLTSKIAKEKVRPSFLTNGSWLEQKVRAERLNDFIYGAFSNSGFYKIAKPIFKDACIFGTGFLYVYREKCDDKWKIKCERVMPDEIMVDPFDGYYGEPRSLYRIKYVSKEWLRTWGISEAKIMKLKTIPNYGNRTRVTDTVQVVQGWHLPTEKSEGRTIIQCNGEPLFDMPWKRKSFPFAWFRYTEEPVGFFGSGVCRELLGDQVELNRMLNFIKESMMICSNPRTYYKHGSIAPQHMTNEIGGMVPFHGDQAPITTPSVAVGNDVFQQLDRIWSRAFEKIGLNELQISGQNQLGAGASGVAFREHNEIQSERFAECQQNWEDFNCEAGKLYMCEAEEIDEEGGDYVVSVSSMDKGTFPLKWKDIKLPKDSYALQVFPRSALPKTPGGRLAYVSEMEAKGLIEPELAQELLNFPDLKAHNMLNEISNIRNIIESMLTQDIKDGKEIKYVTPEPYFNIKLCADLGKKYYTLMFSELPDDTEDERADKLARLDVLRKWIDECTKMIASEQQPQQGMPMGGEGMPMGEAMPMTQGMPMPEMGGQMPMIPGQNA